MNINIIRMAYLMLTMVLVNQDAVAAKIYQWTDEEGVAHFSDVPPNNNLDSEIQEINIINYTARDTDEDKYSIVNQLELMTEWRRQTEETRLARKQLQLEEQRLALEDNSYQLNDGTDNQAYYPSAFYYSYPGYFSGYNKWHGNHWGGHPGPGRLNSGNFKHRYPDYKSDNYKAF